MAKRLPITRSAGTRPLALPIAALAAAAPGLLLALSGCRRAAAPAAPPEPFGPVRSISEIRKDAVPLTGQFVRLRGKIVQLRDLNPGMPFPWDVVYTVDDSTGTVPVHWFTQEKSPKDRRPPTLPGGEVIVTGRIKRDLELDGKTYPVIVHETAELHNQAHPTLPVVPTSANSP